MLLPFTPRYMVPVFVELPAQPLVSPFGTILYPELPVFDPHVHPVPFDVLMCRLGRLLCADWSLIMLQLEPAWKALHFNKVGKSDLDTDEQRLNTW